ncbi:hypothetical protein BDN72DRAFT_307449 [Pluteus cervinus]|uniref:Uncharacterized protein n=1 Tax=Pluteus cervinus TaxID=181527 RepID=A0ACD3AE29_9AGAR|nr:hypothetical protein BDN72DRAFT_307449 [Pluteus cervinus]
MDTPPALSTPSLTAPILPAHLTCNKDIASVFDDEIQYLGMKPAPLRSTPNPYQQVNGVVLHIQRDFNFWRKESDIPLRMVFHKSDTGVVHIGRRPATDSRASKEHDPKSNAMFRCAVVSRVHARIVFSEAGHVYLVDLKSHHGTHIRRPGEAIATMLKPETPTSVYDGDIITFGKSVGKGDDLVRPVVVKIELLYPSRPASDVFKPLLLPGSSFPFASSSLFGRSKSGSYGLRESESPSPSPQPEEAQKETSGRNEEADKPTTSALENLPILSQSSLNGSSNSSLGRALDAIKRFLPPARVSSPFLSHVWGDQSSDNSQGDVSTDHAESGSESSDSSYSVHSSASSSPQPSSPTPLQSLDLDDVTVQAPIASSSKPFIDFSAYDVFGDIDHLIYRARSFSPMDLATPSSPTLPASKPILHPVPRPIAFDPPIIGAWPISNHSSRPASRGNSPLPILPPIQRSFSPALSLSSDMALASDAEDEPDNKGKGREVIDVDEDCVPEIISVCPSPIKVADAPPPAVTGQLSNLNGLITEVHAKLGKLKSMRRDAKIEFDLYSNDTSTKLKDSDERISALEDQYSSLSDRIDLVIDEDISTLRYQLDQLQEQFKAPPPDKDDISSKAEIQREIQILNDLVAGTFSFMLDFSSFGPFVLFSLGRPSICRIETVP